MLGTERAVSPSPEQVPLRTSLLSALQTQDPRLFLSLQPRDHVKIQKWESCSQGKTWDKVYPVHTKWPQSSIPDPGSAGDREEMHGEFSNGSQEDPLALPRRMSSLKAGEGKGMKSPQTTG